MGGFIKGVAAGLASFALGFAVLSVVLEPEMRPGTPAPVRESAPETVPQPPTEHLHDDTSEADVELSPTDVHDEAAAEPEPAPDENALEVTEATSEPADEAEPEVAEGLSEALAEALEQDVVAEHEDALEAEAQPEVTEDIFAESSAPVEPSTPVGPSAPAEATTRLSPAEAEVPQEGQVMAEPEAQIEDPARTEPETPPETLLPTEADARPEPEAVTELEIPAEPETPTDAEVLADAEVLGAADDASLPDATSRPDPAPVAPDAPPPVLRAVPSSPGLDRAVDGVTVGRLPSILPEENGDAPEAGTDAQGVAQADTPRSSEEAEIQPARLRYAAPFDPAPGPLFAIILRDAPADPAAEAAIIALPMPVTIALDPHDPDAPRRARAYRAAGHEVVILATGLPQGATPSDLDVTFEAWFSALPEAVALIDPVEGGFQGNRRLAQAIMPFLADDGHGLITHERGLNPAQQSASSAGVANAAVFRIIDSGDENQFTIRRYLDRATFRAQQEGRVVVMGRAAHPETIDGLIGWRMEGRAGQVAIVPVSALLRAP